MRWNNEDMNSILDLRCLKENEEWEPYCEKIGKSSRTFITKTLLSQTQLDN